MRAIHITTLDGPGSLELVEVPAPESDDLVRVEVKAAGVAFPELLQSRGRYQIQPDLPFVPGAEVAGVVLEAPSSSGFSVGDRVAGLPMLGGFAEQVLIRPDLVLRLPDTVSFEVGASFPFNYGTAYFGLVERGRLQPGETVLVHGAAGGVGTASIQVAKAFGAGRVIGVVSTAEKGEIALAAGADEVVLAEGFKESVGRAVDVVVDPVGGDRFTDSLRTLRPDGRLLVIGFTAGDIPTVKVNRLLLNNISVVGVGWGAYALDRPGHIAQEWAAMLPHLADGVLRPVTGATYRLEQAAEALLGLEDRSATGKVLLLP